MAKLKSKNVDKLDNETLLKELTRRVVLDPDNCIRSCVDCGVGYSIYQIERSEGGCYYLGVLGEDFCLYVGLSYQQCLSTCEEIVARIVQDIANSEEAEEGDENVFDKDAFEENTGWEVEENKRTINQFVNQQRNVKKLHEMELSF